MNAVILVIVFLIFAAGLAGASGLALHHEAERQRRGAVIRRLEWRSVQDDGLTASSALKRMDRRAPRLI